jgi:hypothetical protein
MKVVTKRAKRKFPADLQRVLDSYKNYIQFELSIKGYTALGFFCPHRSNAKYLGKRDVAFFRYHPDLNIIRMSGEHDEESAAKGDWVPIHPRAYDWITKTKEFKEIQ